MKWIVLILGLVFWQINFAQAEKYLKQISKYNESSSFEDSAYRHFDWQHFYQSDMANELVDPNNYDYDLMSAACFFAINKYRFSKSKTALNFNPRLRDAAAIHTDQMVRFNFFDHYNNRDPKIRVPFMRTELCGYKEEKVAENLARSFMDMQKPLSYVQLADKVVKELSKSAEHNEHMLDNYDSAGCSFLFEGINKDGYAILKVTQEFGKKWAE